MGIPILVRRHIYIETGPRSFGGAPLDLAPMSGACVTHSCIVPGCSWVGLIFQKRHVACEMQNFIAFLMSMAWQNCSNSSALAMELLQSCTKPSMWTRSMLILIFDYVCLQVIRLRGSLWYVGCRRQGHDVMDEVPVISWHGRWRSDRFSWFHEGVPHATVCVTTR